MKLFTRSALVASALVLPAAMASATVLPNDGVLYAPAAATSSFLSGLTLVDSKMVPGTSTTFAGVMSVAVYKEASGTLDFLYQFTRTGGGTLNSKSVEYLTGSDFTGYTVDAYYYDGDIDGATTTFTAATNGGSTDRTKNTDGVLTMNMITNPLSGTQSSTTFIFRTNATAYTVGTYGAIDGSTLDGLGYAPTTAVPEPASWAMMVGGFGLLGGALRRKRNVAVSFG